MSVIKVTKELKDRLKDELGIDPFFAFMLISEYDSAIGYQGQIEGWAWLLER